MRGQQRVASGWAIGMTAIILAVAACAHATDPPADELKAKLSSASLGEKPHLCIQIAERQIAAADKLYAANDIEQAQAKLTDVVAFSELARDYAIQSHKHEKQAEIAVRNMVRRLEGFKRLVGHEDQPPIQDAINRMQRVRDDLLVAMFPKGAK